MAVGLAVENTITELQLGALPPHLPQRVRFQPSSSRSVQITLYWSFSHYQTKLNIYKAPGDRVHVFLMFVYSPEE